MWAFSLLCIIAAISVFFAIRYFVRNNIATPQQQKQTLENTLRLLYCLPIFLQGLFLCWIAITHFYAVCYSFIKVLNVICTVDTVTSLQLESLAVLLSGILLLAMNALLLKVQQSCQSFSAAHIFCVLLYVVYSLAMLYMLYCNLPLTLSFGVNVREAYFYTHPAVITISVLCLLLLPASTYYTRLKASNSDVRYLQLAVKTYLLYSLICFSVALAFFILYSFIKIIF